MKYSQLLFLLAVTLLMSFGVVQLAPADVQFCSIECGTGDCSLNGCKCDINTPNYPLNKNCYEEAHGACGGASRWCAD